jgi:hypothetical protein
MPARRFEETVAGLNFVDISGHFVSIPTTGSNYETSFGHGCNTGMSLNGLYSGSVF